MIATPLEPVRHSMGDLHERFLKLLPRIEVHGRIYFRHLKAHEKVEALQEMNALAWKRYHRLVLRGKNPADFMFNFTKLFVRAISVGRRAVGMAKPKDLMNSRAQRKHGFRIEPLPTSPRVSHASHYSKVHGQRDHDAFEERLRDNTQSPVPDQVAFRIDWPAWVRTHSNRDRQIINDLVAGHRTLDVSRKYGISPGRVSQLRQKFRDSWNRFNGEGQLAAA